MTARLTVAVVQQKGGSGKTTLAINLAAAAHVAKKRALVIDMDRQASAFDWSAARREGSPLDGLAVVRADRALALPRSREMTHGYDVVFLDGPPRLGGVTLSAAVATDVALIPLQPGPFDFWAVAETLECLDKADAIRAHLERPPIRRAFVVNRAQRQTRLAREAIASLGATNGAFLGVIHQRIVFPRRARAASPSSRCRTPTRPACEVNQLWQAIQE